LPGLAGHLDRRRAEPRLATGPPPPLPEGGGQAVLPPRHAAGPLAAAAAVPGLRPRLRRLPARAAPEALPPTGSRLPSRACSDRGRPAPAPPGAFPRPALAFRGTGTAGGGLRAVGEAHRQSLAAVQRRTGGRPVRAGVFGGEPGRQDRART